MTTYKVKAKRRERKQSLRWLQEQRSVAPQDQPWDIPSSWYMPILMGTFSFLGIATGLDASCELIEIIMLGLLFPLIGYISMKIVGWIILWIADFQSDY